MFYYTVDAYVGVAYNSRVTMVTWWWKFWLIDFIYGCDNLVGVSVYISLINFGHIIYLMITKLWYNIRMTIIDGFQLFCCVCTGEKYTGCTIFWFPPWGHTRRDNPILVKHRWYQQQTSRCWLDEIKRKKE